MSLDDRIFNYCERALDPGFMAEPLNALTNAAFFIAAWFLYKENKVRLKQDPQLAVLVGLIAVVGAGSTLFHTLATRLFMLADVIPIAIFTFYYLWLALRRLAELNRFRATMLLIIFAWVAAQMKHVPLEYALNGSIAYVPCLAAILLLGEWLRMRSHPAAGILLKAALIFAISLTFRSVDYIICPSFPFGSHFLWHSLNGYMLYVLTRALLFIKVNVN